VLGAAPVAIVSRLITCVKSGPNRPFADVPDYGMAVDARDGFKNALTVRSIRAFRARLGRALLVGNPTVELLTRRDVDAQKHLGMLRSAVLRALPQVDPCLRKAV
jgi:hypothetical protein